MSVLELLGITAAEVKRYRAEHETSIDDAKKHLVNERLLELLDSVQDPVAKLILQVLIKKY
jgi:predicted transcriptional regulator